MDWDEITLSANLCLLSYEDFKDDINKEAFKALGIDLGVTSIQERSNAYTFIVLSKQKDTLFITWRGTDELKDWWNNLDVKPELVALNGVSIGFVHGGIWKHYNLLRDGINKEIDNFVYNGGHRIVFCGYSLGAAVSFCAIETKQRHVDVDISTYLFASPRIGDELFVRSLRNYCERYVHIALDTDVVPKFPLISKFVPFTKTIIIKSGRKNASCVKMCFIRLFNLRVFYRQVLQNHSIREYVNILNDQRNTTNTHVRTRNSYERSRENSPMIQNISNDIMVVPAMFKSYDSRRVLLPTISNLDSP